MRARTSMEAATTIAGAARKAFLEPVKKLIPMVMGTQMHSSSSAAGERARR